MSSPAPSPSSRAEIDAAVRELDANKDSWRAVPIAERIGLLERVVASVAANAERWAEVGTAIKGVGPHDVVAGEEWVSGILPTIRNARLLAEALRHGGAPPPVSTRTRADGRIVARVCPASLFERLLFAGITADVWIQPGKPATQGAAYRARDAVRARDATGDTDTAHATKTGKVCLVLGAGNVTSIPAMDVLYKLFVDDEVVLLKMNPVNEALGPVLHDALAPLVERGVFRIVYGGADVGAYAADHSDVATLHVTGSDRTYDAIVWGSDPDERARRKSRGEKKNTRPFTAELGCVTPVIVVPGPWSKRDIRFQARHVASMVTQNASHNCTAAQVIVTARGWLQREAFLDAVHEELRKAQPRKAYYPGSYGRFEGFLREYPRALVLGAVPPGEEKDYVPWTAIPDVPSDAGGHALTNEAFCGLVAEVTLDLAEHEDGMVRERDVSGPNVPRFLERATTFANERCWGTLSCCLLVHPATEEEHHAALAKAVTDLRYGGVGINAFPGVIYGLVSPTWGAYPGHTAEDIQSGAGVVHNTFLFDHPEKSVVRAPFRINPTPPWFHDHRNLLDLGKRLVAFEASPSWGTFLRVARAAMRG